MRHYIYNLPEMTTIEELIDMRVFKGMTLDEIKDIFDLPVNSYIANFIKKQKNMDPPYNGYDPLDKKKVQEFFRKEGATRESAAKAFNISVKGMESYCSLYDIVQNSDINDIVMKQIGLESPADAVNYLGQSKTWYYTHKRKLINGEFFSEEKLEKMYREEPDTVISLKEFFNQQIEKKKELIKASLESIDNMQKRIKEIEEIENKADRR